MPRFLFSTGKIRHGAVGAVLSDANRVVAVQNVSFEHTFQTAEVREAAHINVYVIENAQYDATCTLSFDATDIADVLIPAITGAVQSVSGGFTVYTGSPTGKPAYIQLEFTGEDADGKDCIIHIPRCKIMTLPLSFARDSYVTPQLQATSYPKAGASDGTQVPFTLRFEN